MQFYSDPSRENDPHALPDSEAFYFSNADIAKDSLKDDAGEPLVAGWYYWSCFPGCLPDGPPIGPFDSPDEAIEDARANADYDYLED